MIILGDNMAVGFADAPPTLLLLIEIGAEHSGDGPCVLPLPRDDKSDGITPIPVPIAISIRTWEQEKA